MIADLFAGHHWIWCSRWIPRHASAFTSVYHNPAPHTVWPMCSHFSTWDTAIDVTPRHCPPFSIRKLVTVSCRFSDPIAISAVGAQEHFIRRDLKPWTAEKESSYLWARLVLKQLSQARVRPEMTWNSLFSSSRSAWYMIHRPADCCTSMNEVVQY